MADYNKTGARKNCSRIEENTTIGDYVVSEDGALATGDTVVVTALPKNSVLKGLTLVGRGLAADTTIVTSIGDTDITAVVPANGVIEATVTEELFTAAVAVSFSNTLADVTSGKITVLPRFIELELTTGNRVEAV